MSVNPNTAASLRPLKIMIVDDSAVVRGLISRWLEQESDMVLAGLAIDGLKAIEKVREIQPDVLILDIEMPNMGGLEALPKLLAAKPGVKVLMASTLTTRGANITLRALELGAADYIPKPDSTRIGGADGFRTELLTKIRALCGRTRSWPVPPTAAQMHSAPPTAAQMHSAPSSAPSASPTASGATVRATPAPLSRPAVTPTAHTHTPVSGTAYVAAPRPVHASVTPMTRSRSTGPKRIDALFVGASTGGPPALRAFLLGLGPDWKLPIFVVQHMPAAFTTIMADHLDKILPMTVVEAKDGMPVSSRHVYIAPGDYHMTVKGPLGLATIELDQNPQINWCRPAVDPLFQSAASLYGNHALAVVLTGMGHDGRDGAAALVAANASVLVQDEASSVVWGMPGAVAEAGLAEIIKPIDGLSAACKIFARGERPS